MNDKLKLVIVLHTLFIWSISHGLYRRLLFALLYPGVLKHESQIISLRCTIVQGKMRPEKKVKKYKLLVLQTY